MVIRRVVLVVGAVAALACGGDDDGGQGPNEPEGDVLVRNNNFSPATLQVEAGATVVWAWLSGGTVHNVTFDDDDVTSGDQGSGTFNRTFAEPGAYPYHCTIHGAPGTGMIGVVNVTAVGGEAGDGGNGGGGGGNGGGYPDDGPGGY